MEEYVIISRDSNGSYYHGRLVSARGAREALELWRSRPFINQAGLTAVAVIHSPHWDKLASLSSFTLQYPGWNEFVERKILPVYGLKAVSPLSRASADGKPRREPDHAPFYWTLPAITPDEAMDAVRALSGDQRYAK